MVYARPDVPLRVRMHNCHAPYQRSQFLVYLRATFTRMFFSFTEIYKLFSRKNMAAAASDAAPSIHQGEALVVTADDSEVIRTLS